MKSSAYLHGTSVHPWHAPEPARGVSPGLDDEWDRGAVSPDATRPQLRALVAFEATGDGSVDLAVANELESTVSVLVSTCDP